MKEDNILKKVVKAKQEEIAEVSNAFKSGAENYPDLKREDEVYPAGYAD